MSDYPATIERLLSDYSPENTQKNPAKNLSASSHSRLLVVALASIKWRFQMMVLCHLVESSEAGIPAAVREQEQQRPPCRTCRPRALLLFPLRRSKSSCGAVFVFGYVSYRLRYLRTSEHDFERYNGLVRLWAAL